jgi:hypothetical protein
VEKPAHFSRRQRVLYGHMWDLRWLAWLAWGVFITISTTTIITSPEYIFIIGF